MTIYYITAALLLCIGIYTLFAFIFALPLRSARKANIDVFSEAKDDFEFSTFLDKMAYAAAGHITIPKSWLKGISKTLISAHIDMPADVYIMRALIQAPMIMVLCLICSIFYRPIVYGAILIPLLLVYSEIRKADKLMKKYREIINAELPDFVSTLANELQNNHDVVRIMSAYLETAGPGLAHELRITIADMKTSDHISALERLADRVNLDNMHDVTRGLIGIQMGNYEMDNFKVLYNRLKEEESQHMKELAQRNIPKLSFCMFIQLIGIVVMFLGVLVADVLSTSSSIF